MWRNMHWRINIALWIVARYLFIAARFGRCRSGRCRPRGSVNRARQLRSAARTACCHTMRASACLSRTVYRCNGDAARYRAVKTLPRSCMASRRADNCAPLLALRCLYGTRTG